MLIPDVVYVLRVSARTPRGLSAHGGLQLVIGVSCGRGRTLLTECFGYDSGRVKGDT
jgi:hypothetical protein